MFSWPSNRGWYRAFLILLLGAFLVCRLGDLAEGRSSALDITVFLVWASLLLSPLFSETSLFGVKLKQIVDDATSEVKREITDTRNELAAAISVQNVVSQNVSFHLPSGSVPKEAPASPTSDGADLKRTAMELKILNTLVTKQLNKFPDFSQRFTFRVLVHLPEFTEWRIASSRLLADGLVGETDEGQIFLTDAGYQYCKKHFASFPKDQWWPDEPMTLLARLKLSE